jgi:hypothetical protein
MTANNSPTDALRMYVNDMVALERHILEAIDRQKNDERLTNPGAISVVGTMHGILQEHVSVMENHAAALGGSTGATLKEAVTSVAGVLAGFYDKIRKDPISRMLRDDYTALNLAAVSYTMLHTTGLALRDSVVANIALRHLNDLTPVIVQLNEVIPLVVAEELADEGNEVDTTVGSTAVSNTQAAWTGPHVHSQHAHSQI